MPPRPLSRESTGGVVLAFPVKHLPDGSEWHALKARPLSKTELAARLGRSRRWVELRVNEGMPSEVGPGGRREFSWDAVSDWLRERSA